jgi:hypothetical protein
MEHQANAKHWVIREQIVADPVTGLTLEFTNTENGEPQLTLYGDCLVFGNRKIVFQNGGDPVHGETAIPGQGSCGSRGVQMKKTRRSHLGTPR